MKMETVKYAFFDCEECGRGFAVEEDPQEPIESPICPAPGCESDMNRFVGTVDMPMPLPIK
jgi:DNA replicative helicase MCM subunit Mcm2 (Cdc46/Mcm family)